MSFARYERYKDSGIEWLGEVPEHWETGRFSRVIHAIKDGTHGTFTRTLEGRPLLSAKNVQNGSIVISDEESLILEEDHGSIVSNGFPKQGDLLLTIIGTIGRSCVYPFDDPIAFQRSVCFIRFVDGVSSKFFYYVTQSKFFQEQLTSRSKSAAQGGVYMGDVRALSVAYTNDLIEQQTITTFLDRETAKIAEQKNLIELLKEKRQAVISHTVTKGLNPAAPMKDSGIEWLGEVPEHWSLPKLKHFTSFAGGGTPSRDNLKYWNGDIPWVSPKDMKTEIINSAEEYITQAGLENSSSSLRPAGRVLMVVRSGILKHTIPVAINEVPVALNQDMKALSFTDGLCLNLFFLRWVQGLNDLLLLVWAKQGATVESIEHTYLAETVIPLPPISEQSNIASFLDREIAKLDTLTNEAKTAITLLQERRTALISAAVTGKIDVRTFHP